MGTELNLSATVVRGEDVMAVGVGREIVMLRLESSAYYSLDEIGAEVWRRLQKPSRVEDLCADLVLEFEVSPETCQRDLLAFLKEAAAEGVIRVVER